MSAAGPGDAGNTEKPVKPLLSLEKAKGLLSFSRLLGKISALVFVVAVFAVFDGLQTLVRHEFNSIDVIPGEQLLISGMLPGGASSHEELVTHMEDEQGIRFTPLETYKGFWMGGQMWRARLDVPADAAPGRAVITVVDILPEEDKDKTVYAGSQNPALVFAINVYADDAARRASDNSLIRRFTGLPAFGVAAGAVLLAVFIGFGSWRAFNKAEKSLADHGVFFIHGVKQLENDGLGPFPVVGYKTAFAHAGKKFYRNEPVLLYDGSWREQGKGNLIEVTKIKAFALFPLDGVRPKYGWLVARENVE